MISGTINEATDEVIVCSDQGCVDTNPFGIASLLALNSVTEDWGASVVCVWSPVKSASLVGEFGEACSAWLAGNIEDVDGDRCITKTVGSRVNSKGVGNNEVGTFGLVSFAIGSDIIVAFPGEDEVLL